jgi:hypothetical protein
MLEHSKTLLVKFKLFGRYVQVPAYHSHEIALKLVDVEEGDATDLGDVLVGVVGVVVHLGGNEDCCQDKPKIYKRRG